jgi:MinD-like ATPase involved in chromosome partitioning or flagellar assembly
VADELTDEAQSRGPWSQPLQRPEPPDPAEKPDDPLPELGDNESAKESDDESAYENDAKNDSEGDEGDSKNDDETPTADEFARRRLVKPAQQFATMGARALLQKSTMGLLKVPPGRRELEYKQDVETVRRNFGGLRQVTIVNPKGGAGKTVAVLLLAMTFGQKRGGYVLAWDNNETQGTLGMRAQQDFHSRTVRDMMRDLHLFQGAQGRVGDLSQYVRSQGEGMFDVLASDESATAGEMLTAGAFAEIRDVVSRFYKLIFVDTGNNVRAENWQAAMDATDQLVITMSARNDSAETAARMLDHLEQSGRRRLVRQAVSVVTMPPTRKDIDLPAIQRHFAARTRSVLLAPYEKLIDSGEPLRYSALSTNTREAWLKIAAEVAGGL